MQRPLTSAVGVAGVAFATLAVLVCVSLPLASCAAPMDAELLRVAALDRDRIEAGVRVEITGEGFPAGREGRVQFEGRFRRPGQAPREKRVDARLRALSSERAVFTVGDSLVDGFGGRGTFHGQVKVEFEAAKGKGTVSGRLEDVTLDVCPDAARRIDLEVRNRRMAEEVLASIGLVPAPEQGSEDGLVVGSLTEGGPAARAGLSLGDRVVAVDGLTILSRSDFVPAPGDEQTILEVARTGEASTLEVPVSLTGLDAPATEGPWWVGAGLVGALLLLLVFVAPTARWTSRLIHALDGDPPSGDARTTPLSAHAASAPNGSRWSRVRARLRRLERGGIALLATTTALGVLPFTAHLWTGGVDVLVLLIATFGAHLTVAVTTAGRRQPRSRLERRRSPVLEALRRLGTEGLPAAASVAAVVLLAGTMRLQGLVEDQGGAPWAWNLFRHPVGFVAFPVFVGTVMMGEGGGRRRRTTVELVAERARRFVGAGLATALFLGGWMWPGLNTDPLAGAPAWRLAGAGLFVLKALALLYVTRRLRPRGIRGRTWPALWGSIALAGAVVTVIAPPPAALERVTGPVLSVLTVAIALHAYRLRTRPRSTEVRLTPFL